MMKGTPCWNFQNFIHLTVQRRDSEPASGTVYRLVLNNPVQAEDFESPFEEKPQRFKNKPNKIKCRSCGLSVHTNPQDSETLKKWVGKLRNAQIAKGELNTHGLV